MNLPVNVQHPASQPPPVTPPRRTTRPPFTPSNNQICRSNDSLLRRRQIPIHHSQQNDMTSQAQALAQANARAVHARLQQQHSHLQLQLQARPAPPSPAPAGPVKAFLDTTFRAYAARIQTEFNSLRTACARAVQREQREAEDMRSACVALARQRDVAEEKLRVLLERRECSHKGLGKRTREYIEYEEELDAAALLYPPSPVSPPQLPIQSPPPRLLSPFVLAARRGASLTPDPDDGTAFDLTVSCDSLPRPCKKRRVSGSPSPHLGDDTETKERVTCYPAGLGECDMDLESSESEADAEACANPSTSHSQSHSRGTSASPAIEAQLSLTTTPPALPTRGFLELEYVDIMYVPSGGKLLCRVCLLAPTSSSTATKSNARASPVQSFSPSESWQMLRMHCEDAHPEACQDVVGLGREGVRELRRRLGLSMGTRV
ncbi:hypothetical protein B0H10DRAFT_2040655 [Mycena sp. CBHHK59/15]|nr:hypothetical protein B0H10DRAFT_2040655 [Mycena sp. CBHHK59/15]